MCISFIIPTKNESKYVEECIKSIKKQHCQKEIIVVDATNDAETMRIAKKHDSAFVFECRKGVSIARNTGASRAKGDILVFTDADVRFEDGFAEKISSTFSKEHIAGCVFNLKLWDADNYMQTFGTMAWNSVVRNSIRLGLVMTNGACFAYRKDIFMKCGGFDTELFTNEDHDLAKRASKYGRFKMLDLGVFTSVRRFRKLGFLDAIKENIKSTIMYVALHKSNMDYWKEDSHA
ncbi:MAG: glycosyltransferase [Candidatus Aenigmatarchaeota archaeon]